MTARNLLEQICKKYGEEGLRAALLTLPPREEMILRLWTGFDKEEPHAKTFREIGKEFGLSGARIGQIVSKSRKEILNPTERRARKIEEILSNWRRWKEWDNQG